MQNRIPKRSALHRENYRDLWRVGLDYSTEHDQHICVSKLSKVRGKNPKKLEDIVPGTHSGPETVLFP